MKLDFLICGSPTEAFFSQIAFFRVCLDFLGGIYKEARLVAVFGADQVASLPDPWKPYFQNINVEWVSPEEFMALGYNAQHYRRFELIQDDADFAFICDADVAVLRTFDELLSSLAGTPSLAGVIAHYHFPRHDETRDPDEDWEEIARAVIGSSLRRTYRYTLHGKDALPTAPFYVNYGVLVGPPAVMKRFYYAEREIRPKVAAIVGNWWAPQVSVPLTCADRDIPTIALSMRYNFPNDPKADELYPEELENIVFLHYLRTEHFDRHKIFTSKDSFDEFLQLDLVGSNQIFQEHVKKLTACLYPFQR